MSLKSPLIFFSLALTLNIYAQEKKEDKLDHSKNFYDIVKEERSKHKKLLRSNRKMSASEAKAQEKAIKRFERWVYAWKDRVNIDGSFPNANNNVEYKKEVLKQLTSQKAAASTWGQVGPVDNPARNRYSAYPGKGRVNVVVQDPTDANTLYAGSAGGGLWKTTNNGVNWVSKTDHLAGLGVTDILIDPNNTNIIYIATGDGDGRDISSIGLFKSTNGGDTWAATGLTFSLTANEYIRDIAFAPGNSSRIFVLTSREIRVSNNAGATWTNVPTGTNFNELFQTIVFDPNDPTKVVVSDYWEGIYVSTNSGKSFSLHPEFKGGNSRKLIKLTTTPNDPDHFYGLNDSGEFKKFRFNMDNTSADLVSTVTISDYNAQGGYNVCLAISPTNKDNIIVGGVRGYRSTDNGATFSVLLNPYNNPPGVGFYVHPDFHHFSFLPDGNTILTGHDGGVHKGPFSGASSSNWRDLSPGLNITQSYNIAITQARNGDDFMMGNQDNDGFSKVLKDGTRQWVSAAAGDGTGVGIDYNTPSTRYLGGTRGRLSRSDDGYASSAFPDATILSSDNDAAFVSPFTIHPTTPTTVYAGHSDIKTSTNRGSTFTSLNSGLTGARFLDVTQNNNSSISIYAIGTMNSSTTTRFSNNNGSTWTTIIPPAPNLRINSIAAVPNSNVVYATVSGYINGNKVFRSSNGGASWVNISEGLPNITMRKVAVKYDVSDETLFLGTELGVYWRSNSSTTWKKLGEGLPNVIITDLKINYTDQLLYIGTYGRGMWKHSISNNTLGTNDDVYENEVGLTVFPNPVTNNQLNIRVSDSFASKKLNYTIYNYVGGVVKSGTINNKTETIATDDIAKGIYLMRVSDAKSSVSKKIIIQ